MADKSLWPRLSVDLPHGRDLSTCQACGKQGMPFKDLNQGDVELLTIWQEHDENDRPEPIFVVLCHECAAKLIEPHPRLYRELDRYEPVPGVISACIGCSFSETLRCHHPLLKANGGPGLLLHYSEPTRGIACGRGKNGRRISRAFTIYTAPARCAGRQDRAEAQPRGGTQ